MNTTKIFIALLFITAFVESCSQERPISGTGPNGSSSGTAKVKIHVNIPEMSAAPVGSKAPSEIVEMQVMTFDATDPLLPMTDAPQVAVIEDQGTAAERYFVASLNASATPRLVVVVVNAGSAISDLEGDVGGWKVVGEDDGGTSVTPATATKFPYIEANLKTPDLSTLVLGVNTYIDEQPSVAPMTGSVEVPDVRSGMIITTSSGQPVSLTRATARFTVEVPTPIPNFSILGASLGNAPLHGFVMPQPSIPVAATTHHDAHPSSTDENTGYHTLVGALGGGSRTDTLYSYEDNKLHELFIILHATYKGVAGYYRINIVKGAPADPPLLREQWDILRNTWYKVFVQNVGNYGYSNVRDAILNKASNIECEIIAYVPGVDVHDDAHDIVSNSNYFLGVSNSIFYAYSNDTGVSGSLVATTLTHSAAAAGTTARVKIMGGTGIALNSAASVALTPISSTEASFNPALNQKIPIEVTLNGTFKYAMSDTLMITLGDLVKKIAIGRRPQLPFGSNLLTDFATGTCVTALPATLPSWLRFSTQPDGTSAVDEIPSTPQGYIYVVYQSNIAQSGASERNMEVYFAQNNDKGRIKANFSQAYLNIGDIVETRLEPSYAGAFWRAGERGERIVRIPVGSSSGNLGPWSATVIWLDDRWDASRFDGVVLDTLQLGTAALSSRGISWTSVSYPFSAEGYLVPGIIPTATGTVAANGYIEFRIGLQQKYAPLVNYPARYSVVLLTYGAPVKMQRLYLRQGEEADYLMRPDDPGDTPDFNASSRPLANKFSPYNLTVPPAYTESLSIPPTGNPNVGLPYKSGSFTDYPSKAGAMFFWNYNRQAFPPHHLASISGWSAGLYTDFWNAGDTETCPPNFRRPMDGDITFHNPLGAVAESEVRQSLWLYPYQGAFSNTLNSVWGYYADGYFDRYMVVPGVNNVGGDYTQSAVSTGNNDVAYIGRLFFNPANNASLFFPAAGFRQGGALLSDAGYGGAYWSTTSVDGPGGVAWYLSVGQSIVSQLNTGAKATLASVRCVFDPCFPIAGITITPSGSTTLATGGKVGLTATLSPVNATHPITWVWERSFDGGNTWLPIPRGTNPTLDSDAVIVGVTKYRVTASNCGGSKTSSPIDITGTGMEPIPPVPLYVGAFWKNNQRGERLVHIPRPTAPQQPDAIDGTWEARVVVGDSWISLDTNNSSDTQLGWLVGNDSSVDDMMTHDAMHLVPGANTLVGGTVSVSSPQIYFRIGLRATQASGTAPRYGVVLLTYKNHDKSQRIFVRQGETDDYLMRLSDPGALRTEVQRFSPYNLKDPNENTQTNYNNMTSPVTGLLNPRGGTPVDYPSQAGYFFQWNFSNRAFHPTNPTGNFGGWPASSLGVPFWSFPIHETCPEDYRRPKDGVSHNNTGLVAGSEIRQSLWLNPPSGASGNGDNSVWGYYADGFFDRRVVVNGQGGATVGVDAAVAATTSQAAYTGKLFVNPYNNASLFFPAAGYREAGLGPLWNAGTYAYYWTSTSYDANYAWATLISASSASQSYVTRGAGFHVRCIYELGVKSVTLTRTPSTGNISIGNHVLLTASVTPSAAPNVLYEWQFSPNGGTHWITLAQTSANTYNAPVYLVGTNSYRVIASNGNGEATSNTVTVAGVLGPDPGTTPTVPIYAGAFWRVTETGERIIRIGVNSDANNAGIWVATVSWLDGRWGVNDGVEMTTSGLDAPGLAARNISWSTPTTPNPAENFQVTGDNYVNGVVGTGGYIEFRIGLKSTYTANATYPARYGVVLLTYGNGRWLKIFLRQGEDPDYLMRPSEPNTPLTSRPNAVKFSPFNLKDPLERLPNHANSQGQGNVAVQALPLNGAAFTPFPSQTGYIFPWNVNRWAFPPLTQTIGGWNDNQYNTGFWESGGATAMETCPANYTLTYGTQATFRRPRDGSQTAAVPTPSVTGSEIRQSLWLNPVGDNSNNTGNSIWCYYADGYFDRRAIAQTGGTTNTVAGGTIHVGALGRLFYNPETNASLFFPAGGEGAGNTGLVSNIGASGGYWTSSAVDNAQGGQSLRLIYYLYLDNNSSGMDTRHRSYLKNIRCVQN